MERVFRDGREAAFTALTGIVLAAVVGPHAVIEHQDAFLVMLWELAFAGAVSLVAWRFFVAGAYASTEGLRIVNPFGVARVAWADIAKVSVGSYGRWMAVAIIELRDGRRLPIVGIRASSRGAGRRRVERSIRELDRLRAVRQGIAATTEGSGGATV